jgi:hypothetical protein
MPHTLFILAQSDSSGFGSVLLWSLVLIAALAGLFVAVSWLRKWMKEDDVSAPVGFTLSDLRQLHKSGQMTTEEFERAKAKMVAATQAAMARKEEPPKPERRPRIKSVL